MLIWKTGFSLSFFLMSCNKSLHNLDVRSLSHMWFKSIFFHCIIRVVFFIFLMVSWRRKWQPPPVLLPGKSCGRRSQIGYSPWGRKESDTTERLHFHFEAQKFSILRFPGGPVAKTPHSQCRRPQFDPWSGTRSPMLQLGARMPQLKIPRATPCHNRDWRSHVPQLRPGAAK